MSEQTILERLDAIAPPRRDIFVSTPEYRIWLHGPAASRPEALVAAIKLLINVYGLPAGWLVVVEPNREGDKT